MSVPAAGIAVRSGPVRLRPTTDGDLAFVLDAEGDADNAPYVLPWSRDRHHDALSDRDKAHLVLENAEDDMPVGYVILAGLAGESGSVEFRRLVVTEKGKGYGRLALRLVKKLAFEELGAHRLWLDVKEGNTRARHVYGAEGFVVEGVLRECIKTEDAFDSLVVMSMLESEYRS